MRTVSVDAASEKLTGAVGGMDADDLLQVYNELFPDDPATDGDTAPLVEHIVDHISHGLEPEEVVDLWNVVFPQDREVYFNEEDNLLHFDEDEGIE
jgi:hypothetical protein